MVSDSFSIYGLRKTPYIILASIGGIVSAASLWLARLDYQTAAALLLIANLSIASPDVMIDGTTAENSSKHPQLAADLQTLSWASLRLRHGRQPRCWRASKTVVDWSETGFLAVMVDVVAALLPACLGWLASDPLRS